MVVLRFSFSLSIFFNIKATEQIDDNIRQSMIRISLKLGQHKTTGRTVTIEIIRKGKLSSWYFRSLRISATISIMSHIIISTNLNPVLDICCESLSFEALEPSAFEIFPQLLSRVPQNSPYRHLCYSFHSIVPPHFFHGSLCHEKECSP
jgi:hypothetical protein